MRNTWQDIRYSARIMLKQPSFSIVAIITLALGVGANTAIFSVVNSILLRPLPYKEPSRLITTRSNESAPDLRDVAERNQTLESVGGLVPQAQDYTGGVEPVQIQVGLVTGGYFQTLGVEPLLGRSISYDDDKEGGARIIVLSHELWRRDFGGDKNVLGKVIPLSGNSYEIVGVMPARFKTPQQDSEAWSPLHVVNPIAAKFRGVHFLRTVYRLKQSVTIEQARRDLARIDGQLAAEFPSDNKNRRTTLFNLQERIVGDVSLALWILFGAVGLVLLIACVNFANLLLGNAASRQQELVIRAALGAGRARIIRQIITESLLISCLGGLLGLLIAYWGIEWLIALKPSNLPRLDSIKMDGRVFLFTLGVSLLTGLIFGLIPAWTASNLNVNEGLKEGGRSASSGRSRNRLRSALVIAELALSLILLTGAGLLIKSLWKLNSVEPGFNAEELLTMILELPESRYKEIPKQTQYRASVLEAVNSLPGVEAAMISEVPMSGNSLNNDFVIEGSPPIAPGDEPDLYSRTVMGDYFRVMQIQILQGRDLTPQDDAKSLPVGVVNESMVRTYFPNENPIGKRIRWVRDDKAPWVTIVGVVRDVKHFGLDQPEQPAIYAPYAQMNTYWKRWMVLVARSERDTASLTSAIKKQIWTVDKQIPPTNVHMMKELMAESLAAQRFYMQLLALFAAVALLLAVIGIYGVTSYTVSQRTHEIGIRMALGARSGDVMKMVLGQGAKLALIGVAIGLIGSFALTRLMVTLLFGVGTRDPLTFVSVSLILVVVALAACLIPARKAAHTDPMIALRYK